MSNEDRHDQERLRRRLEALKLPVAPLRRHGLLARPDATEREPEAIGVGPDGTALAVWRHRDGGGRRKVTWHSGGRRPATATVEVDTELQVSFVQPLPDGGVLLVAARARAGVVNAEIWSADGEPVRRGHLGDAIEEVQTTYSGKVWVGYFDEAMGGSGPEGHGLARFRVDLTVDWLYPQGAGLPTIVDCYTLNVEGETAYFCPYTDFHVLSATGDRVTDWGASPRRSAHHLLRRGADLALLTGFGPEYDVATLLRIGRDGVRPHGGSCRVVMPDGLETNRLRYTCRGDTLHAFAGSFWYTVDLGGLSVAADHPHRAG